MTNIYLICAEFEGEKLYKIGFTKREIEKRIKEFKTGNAAELSLVDSFSSIWGTKIEARLHKMYKSVSIRGEWFKLTTDDVKTFKKNCQIIHDNFQFISENNSWFEDEQVKLNKLK